MTPLRRLLTYFDRYKLPLATGFLCVIGSATFSMKQKSTAGPTTIFKRVQSVGLMLSELGDGHLSGRDERRYAGEQSDQDQQA